MYYGKMTCDVTFFFSKSIADNQDCRSGCDSARLCAIGPSLRLKRFSAPLELNPGNARLVHVGQRLTN